MCGGGVSRAGSEVPNVISSYALWYFNFTKTKARSCHKYTSITIISTNNNKGQKVSFSRYKAVYSSERTNYTISLLAVNFPINTSKLPILWRFYSPPSSPEPNELWRSSCFCYYENAANYIIAKLAFYYNVWLGARLYFNVCFIARLYYIAELHLSLLFKRCFIRKYYIR